MWFNPALWKNSVMVSLLIAVVCLGGCKNQPTDEQLEVWRKEAIARNVKIVADNAKKNPPSEWNLAIQGETTTGKPVELNWQQLQALATSHVKTIDANYIIEPNRVFDFRGVSVSKLLKKFGINPDVTEVTFVCYDSYLVTVKLKHLLTFPIMLAIARNGKPIGRDQGGPIYLVFPHTQYPKLKPIYPESSWAFYVSHIIIGTEPMRLRVGKRELTSTDLDKLPQVTISETVGYRNGWPSGKVELHGVRVRDVLATSNIPLTSKNVVIKGKAPIYRSAANPITLNPDDVRNCDILLATKWGDDKQPIPTKIGGPITLAFSSNCQTKTKDLRWVPFVEELAIQP